MGRPSWHQGNAVTVNDLDGMIANFWRATKWAPEKVAEYADWPVNENDLHARHAWLVGQKESLQSRLEGNPDFYDAKIAGWWVWGMSIWIGAEFCKGHGSWVVIDGELVYAPKNGTGVNRQRVNLGDKGQGVHRQSKTDGLYEWFEALSSRLRRVRVCCGDWSRVCGEMPMERHGEPIGVFLDPPYSDPDRDSVYSEDSFEVAKEVRSWALEKGEDKRYRIALCGYEGEHEMPGWEKVSWKAKGGMQHIGHRGNINNTRERIWFSPYCKKPAKQISFSFAEGFE